MGLRVRLNASYDCSPLKRTARIFCTALKTYGGIFADNGSPWYFSGEPRTVGIRLVVCAPAISGGRAGKLQAWYRRFWIHSSPTR